MDLASSDLPTPVGPEKMNDATGRLGFFSPVRARRIAREHATTASSWPMRREWSVSSMFISWSPSAAETLSTGMPVQDATMLQMSCSCTVGPASPPPASMLALFSSCFALVILEISVLSSTSLSRSAPAASKSCERIAVSFSLSSALSSLSSSFASSGSAACARRTREPASSIRSIALSGRKRSEMYWCANFAAASMASSV
mmetsp:Transcript_13527/g.56804  ORF Transcript_13527/g.56804 Transcript_13527/m.56804 type:complete len:201 (+) Transcript_13527:1056-1658(+)